MATLDVFKQRAFHMVELTAALNKQPYLPQLLGSLNLFETRPVRTTTVAIEQKNGNLNIIATSPRGAPLQRNEQEKRDIRDFRTVRIAQGDRITADEIQDIRAFGSETEMMQVQQEVADRLRQLRRNVEITHERMRLGAIKGQVLDKDDTVIKNWFTEWGVSQPAEVDFALGTEGTDVRGKCSQIVRAMAKAAQGLWTPATEVHAVVGHEFYDALSNHPRVRETFLNWSAAADLREGAAFSAFPFGGIMWHDYRGSDDGSKVAVAADKAHFFPVNAPGAFQVALSPAETFDFANTRGQEVYAMVIPDEKRNAFVDVEVYSYPLHICTRPKMLQRAGA
ncbi:hypothetical protein J2T57_002600 [Natronocella acetinitrilica]|uniref:Major capsid protein n=1 Tax=Natronocella acetinitrilica TaxID=414046 RepID=A0AAE3G445_9GAMM|nr:major capsid protein [Natronocella acetinitrilica]MCP1675450.1 hypothetical protein [Natronocella acetinitrilica]